MTNSTKAFSIYCRFSVIISIQCDYTCFQVLLPFTRDATIQEHFKTTLASAPRAVARQSLESMVFPPSGVIPFHGFSMYGKIRFVFKWLMRAFSGFLAPDQVLLLWDRILGFDSLEILSGIINNVHPLIATSVIPRLIL
ncbi:uncharacterized protein DEA37_0004970 [Paragonimus westermani]|uniref:Rab-GAP TBC domain-containing protein n=1 Tax=Paragonimus westermani TaxID=34504 RepID=A0A5J4NF83_9TREM|nr:uncharacterized protein DEA37_0004970 [Paragonimus westermani]